MTANSSEITGLPARRAALKMLDAVYRRGESLDQASHAACQGISDRADRALAIAIASEVMRWSIDLDSLIDGAMRQPLDSDVKAKMVLRIALVQVLVLKTPPHAAISTALPLVQGGPKRLVHGVFGTLMRSDAGLPEVPTLPHDVADRWTEQWGNEMVQAAARALAAAPPLDLVLRDMNGTVDLAEKLGGTSLMPGHVRIPRAGAIDALEGFGEGAWWVQDISASLPARLLGSGEARHVLDLCAAPGGKTMQLAAQGWKVTALDKSQKRLARLEQNLKRTGLAAETVAADVMNWKPSAPVDAILLDAPCSATGIFRRHPDVLHRVGGDEIAALSDIQSALLERAAGWLKPGGMIVYATCSLEKDEGEAQIAEFLATHDDMAVVPVRADELPDGIAPHTGGWVRTLPGMFAGEGGLDGFFMIRLKRMEK